MEGSYSTLARAMMKSAQLHRITNSLTPAPLTVSPLTKIHSFYLFFIFIRSSPGDVLIDLLKSGGSVRPSVRTSVHKTFFRFRCNLVFAWISTRYAYQCDLDPIHGQGQGHAASEVPKIALSTSISSAILTWSSKPIVDNDSMGSGLELVEPDF